LKLGKKRTRGKRVLDNHLLELRLLVRTRTRAKGSLKTKDSIKAKEVDEVEGQRGVDQVPELVDEVEVEEEGDEVVPKVVKASKVRDRDNLKRHDPIHVRSRVGIDNVYCRFGLLLLLLLPARLF
jgi:hypothetical protein